MALKKGAGKKLGIFVLIAAVAGVGISHYTGASSKIQPKNVDSAVTTTAKDTITGTSTVTEKAVAPAKTESTYELPQTPVHHKAAHVAPKKHEAEAPATKHEASKPAKKKGGDRENLELDNF